MKIFISRDGQQLGPYSVQQINAGAAFGSFTASDLAWIEGWANWQPLSMVPGFLPPVSAPSPYLPPLPQKNSIAPLTSTTSPKKEHSEPASMFKRILKIVIVCAALFGAYQSFTAYQQARTNEREINETVEWCNKSNARSIANLKKSKVMAEAMVAAYKTSDPVPVGEVPSTATSLTPTVVPVLELTKVPLTGKTESFTTLDGDQYTGVIKRVQPDGIVLRTADGVPKIKFKKLPPEVRVKYGYDHDLEIQFLQYENTANMAAYQKQLQLNEFRKTAAIAAEAEKQRLAAEAAEAKAEMMKPPMHIKVIQVIKDGVLADVMHSAPQMSSLARMGGSAGFAGVVGGYESSGNIIFIVGMKGVTDNQELDIKLKRDGIYEYDSVSGANKTIERYSLLQ